MTQDGIEESTTPRPAGAIRRRIGLGIAMSGVLAVVAGGVFVGVTNARAAADDARSMEAVAEAAASIDELPPVEPVVPDDPSRDPGAPVSPAAGVDYSKTPEGWFDATTDPADVVIPPTDDRGEPSTGIWEKQRQITARCMADQGFWYAWTNDRSKLADPTSGMILSDQDEAARLALWGTNPDDQPYDWRLGGCDGYAVHTTGMDDAH